MNNSNIRILIAEDSAIQAEALRRILVKEGYTVSVAKDGAEGLSKAKELKPELVISDIMMPEMNGFELCRHIKSDADISSTPVILLTSLSDPTDVISGLECGADNFIVKPYDEHHLLSRIKHIFLNRELQETSPPQGGVEIHLAGRKYSITAEKKQILDLLISTYENAVQKNTELVNVREELEVLNEGLEQKVQKRTAAIAEEIEVRKQTEKALKTSEERLKTMFKEAPMGIALIASLTGHVYEVNNMFAKIAGRTLEQMANIDLMSITHPDDVQKYLDNMALLNAGKIQGFQMEKRYLHPDGTVVWINMTVAPLKSEDKAQPCHLCMIEDITERKRLEKARKELEATKLSEDEARESAESIINTVREPLIVLDQDLRVVTVSRSFYEFFKVKPEETVGQLIYDLGNKQWDIPKLRELLEDILPKKVSFDNYEVEHDFTTIGRRIMLLNARQIERAMGKERIILLAIEDITERKEIETGLEKTRKELEVIKQSADEVSEFAENVINTVREPLIALDQNLRVVKVSNSFYEFFKVKPEETVGQLIYDLGNKQWDIPKLRELLETILPQKATFDNYEVEHDFTTIGRRIMLLNARQIERAMGKERIILLAIEDITERKEIEGGLEKTRKELEIIKKTADEVSEFAENVINTVREPLIALDQNLRVVKVSNSFYEFFKVKPEETVGQLIYDLGNKQWDIPKLRELLETILPQKATFDNYEVEHDFTTIGRRIMLLNARQIQRASGKDKIILLAIEDITERKEIENGLEKAHEELNELAAELNRTARAKSEFLANMSHELRTPLNSINGFSEVLYDETFGPLNEKQKKYVNNVLTSGKHLLLLINQILDMAKVEAGKMTLALSNLPMKSLLHEISLLVADMVSKKKLEILLEIAEDLPDIEADDLKVKEIIYNLLSNAVKFTPEGGEIGMSAKKVGSEIEIVVWDTGVGIAPENMEKIFEGFFRVDTPYSRVTEGTGLGLPLSKKLVELHSGKLSVESAGLGKGTAVRFTLPIISGKVV